MTHFMVGVIVPRLPQEAMNSKIAELLAPYSENLEVEEYDRECWCVNSEARKYGREMADKLVGNVEERRDGFKVYAPVQGLTEQRKAALLIKDWDTYNTLDEQIDAHWRTFNIDYWQQYEETMRDYEENHPRYNQPDTDCSSCNGKGAYRSEYNPDSKWDWYRIGGRFDGLVTDNPQESDNGFNFHPKHQTLVNNSVPVEYILAQHAEGEELFSAYALVTPDGKWIERGQMGWFGMSSGDKPENVWEAERLNIYRKFRSYDLVILDCHI